jgi:hypothetical protein
LSSAANTLIALRCKVAMVPPRILFDQRTGSVLYSLQLAACPLCFGLQSRDGNGVQAIRIYWLLPVSRDARPSS